MNLGFIHPALLWGALVALLPLLVHLFFRRRPRPVSFPAVEFILRARRETQRRLRLRRLLLFAARTALLLLVALALARPELRHESGAAASAAAGPAAVALVLDATASMTYRLGDEPLFERARSDLDDAVDGLGSADAATLVVCGGPAPSAPAPSYDRGPLRRSLREARPTLLHADLGTCLGAAAVALSDPGVATLAKRIVVATDLAASSWHLAGRAPEVNGPRGPERPDVRVVDAARGAAMPNRAVAELDAEPDLAAGPRGYRVTATVANTAAHEPARDVRIELRTSASPTAPVAVKGFVDVPAGGTAKKTLIASFEEGGPGAVSVSLAPDPLAMDDARVLAVAVPRDAKALVVNGSPSPVKFRDEAFFLEAALASAASPVRTTLVDLGGLARHRFADFDVVFLLNVRELGPRAAELRSFVEAGGGLFVALGDEVSFEVAEKELAGLIPPLHVVKTATEAGRPARFDAVDFGHPALAVFSGDAREGLLGARTFKYALVRPDRRDGGARILASFDDGAPALVETHAGRGRVVLFTSSVDRDWSDWSIRTSFLPAMQRFAAYLAGVEERQVVASVVGASRALELAEGQRLVALVAPDGREVAADALPRSGPPGSPPVVIPDAPGLWQVRVEARGEVALDPALAFAVLPDTRESDTRRVDAAELTAWLGGADHAALAEDARGERRVPLWSILLALALAAFVAESALAAR